jgi:DNA-binding transcriptional ArsR family regulator
MKSDIEKMKKLRNLGYTFIDIAKLFKVSETTVRYHLNPIYKELVKRSSKDRRTTPEGRKSQNKYYKNRYKTDEEFRKRHIERSRRYQKEHPEQHEQYDRKYKEKAKQKKSESNRSAIILMVLIATILIMVLGLIAYFRWFVWGI